VAVRGRTLNRYDRPPSEAEGKTGDLPITRDRRKKEGRGRRKTCIPLPKNSPGWGLRGPDLNFYKQFIDGREESGEQLKVEEEGGGKRGKCTD